MDSEADLWRLAVFISNLEDPRSGIAVTSVLEWSELYGIALIRFPQRANRLRACLAPRISLSDSMIPSNMRQGPVAGSNIASAETANDWLGPNGCGIHAPLPPEQGLGTEQVQQSASAAPIYARGLASNDCVSPGDLDFD